MITESRDSLRKATVWVDNRVELTRLDVQERLRLALGLLLQERGTKWSDVQDVLVTCCRKVAALLLREQRMAIRLALHYGDDDEKRLLHKLRYKLR